MNHIRYVEYDARHTQDFVFHVPQGHDCWLLVLTRTPALFSVPRDSLPAEECQKESAALLPEGHRPPPQECQSSLQERQALLREYPAGSAVLYAPGMPIHYQACGDRYENDWCRFDSDEEAVLTFPLLGTPFSLADAEYCHNLFQLLTWKNSFPGSNNERIVDQLLALLFTELNEAAGKYTPHRPPHSRSQDLLALRKAIYNAPQEAWSVSVMAQRLHLSEGYLQTLYRDAFGLSCMDDCIRARIRLARDQLLYTEKTVASVAEFCGYRNVEHFCRQFKQLTGTSPSRFRQAGEQGK